MRAPILAVALAAAACAISSSPSEVVHDMQIEDVSVRFEPAAPPRPVAHIRGIIPDGCSSLNAVEQIRTGNTVLVISQITDEATGAHRYIHWPRERFCWFKDSGSA